METIINYSNKISIVKSIAFQVIFILSFYALSSFSHLVGFPLYYFDLFRIFVCLSILILGKPNSIILGITLPLFSYFTANHPSLIKTSLISFELLINILTFYYLTGRKINLAFSIFIAIAFSKIFYYLTKYISLEMGLIKGKLISTPLEYQIIVTLIITISYFIYSKVKS